MNILYFLTILAVTFSSSAFASGKAPNIPPLELKGLPAKFPLLSHPQLPVQPRIVKANIVTGNVVLLPNMVNASKFPLKTPASTPRTEADEKFSAFQIKRPSLTASSSPTTASQQRIRRPSSRTSLTPISLNQTMPTQRLGTPQQSPELPLGETLQLDSNKLVPLETSQKETIEDNLAAQSALGFLKSINPSNSNIK